VGALGARRPGRALGALAGLAVWLALIWTNPPDLDLYSIRFFAVQAGGTDTLVTDAYLGTCPGDPCFPALMPGAADSIYFALPCFSAPTAWYIWAKASDASGNEQPQASNVVQWVGLGG
jgi:hypothetical protein